MIVMLLLLLLLITLSLSGIDQDAILYFESCLLPSSNFAIFGPIDLFKFSDLTMVIKVVPHKPCSRPSSSPPGACHVAETTRLPQMKGIF
ncbi:hypothetical protein F4809DRAFT_600881 [Biscogniauxia mediterranea]|nr:hypothetical protein F4809DRAFT_600881 [Biscogniauxia mediterranea]